MSDPLDTELAPAKVNLFLHVTGRRPDGYHLLDSLVAFAEVADRVSYAPAEELSLTVTGPFAASLPENGDNLVSRAAHALAAAVGARPAGRLILEKRIPVASGIGGGSADAAATLRLLCRVWRVRPDAATLDRIAVALGADVLVCLRNAALRMRGIGERLTTAPPLPQAGLLLVNPGQLLSTADVFRARSGVFSGEAELRERWASAGDLAIDLARARNDLESAAISLVPAIADVLRSIAAAPGCLLARMSGSGATCFGLFADPEAARTAASGLGRPDWWYWAGALAR
jgi:4-diphosphocytidyl-2-C-methyl-D-erythritol kinase